MFTSTQAARYLGISLTTLRRWDREGRLIAFRTVGNHRRYKLDQLQTLYGVYDQEPIDVESIPIERCIYCYCRVSTWRQKDDGNLDRQAENLIRVVKRDYGLTVKYKLIKEFGSGLNSNRKGLRQLLHAIQMNKVSKLYLAYPDRILRFAYNLIELICREHQTQIVITDRKPDISFQEEFIQDFMALLAIFSGKMYKQRALQAKERLNSLDPTQKHNKLFRRLKASDSEDAWISYEIQQACTHAETQILRRILKESNNSKNHHDK